MSIGECGKSFSVQINCGPEAFPLVIEVYTVSLGMRETSRALITFVG
jgi:hypothetical protein